MNPLKDDGPKSQKVVLGPDGITRSVHITSSCPALAFNSWPLWTMHNHILEKTPKHKRIDGDNLEIFCCMIS